MGDLLLQLLCASICQLVRTSLHLVPGKRQELASSWVSWVVQRKECPSEEQQQGSTYHVASELAKASAVAELAFGTASYVVAGDGMRGADHHRRRPTANSFSRLEDLGVDHRHLLRDHCREGDCCTFLGES